MAQFQPRQIIGKWRQGYALDLHTLYSIPIGHNEFGHMQFDTRRSELGELLYRLKYAGDRSVVPELVDAAVAFLNRWKPAMDLVVPVPPSNPRAVQPVRLLAQGIAMQCGIAMSDGVTRLRDAPQLKQVYDLDERLRILDDLHAANASVVAGKRILLFDDLFRSGATMNAITTALIEQGGAAEVFALTITRTRSNQ